MFERLGATLISVSTDTELVHRSWKQSDENDLGAVEHLMGSDPSGKLARLFGVYDEGSKLALRGTYIIAPDGTLLNSEVNFYNMGRNIDELMRKLKANVYLRERKGESCPSKWKDDGEENLRPGTS